MLRKSKKKRRGVEWKTGAPSTGKEESHVAWEKE